MFGIVLSFVSVWVDYDLFLFLKTIRDRSVPNLRVA